MKTVCGNTQKSAGTVPLPVPRFEAFALPILQRQATQSPRRYEIKVPPSYVLPLYMMIQSTIIDIFMVTYKRDANIITPRSIYRCPAFC